LLSNAAGQYSRRSVRLRLLRCVFLQQRGCGRSSSGGEMLRTCLSDVRLPLIKLRYSAEAAAEYIQCASDKRLDHCNAVYGCRPHIICADDSSNSRLAHSWRHKIHGVTVKMMMMTMTTTTILLMSFYFYRATLCVSAVFAVARCLSVCHVRVLYPDG